VKLVIFGLSISSSWGNGHATIWRGLCREIISRGHRVIFFEKDVPYYAAHRDLFSIEGGELHLYSRWEDVLPIARGQLTDADVAMVTSYCPDGISASELVLDSNCELRVFYDLDTPVTLQRLRAGENVPYLKPGGLAEFDLVLSFTGGPALREVQTRLKAKRVVPLYGSVDPSIHKPVPARPNYLADLSYLGTYSADRLDMLKLLFIEVAHRLPERRFLLGGSLYPADFPWTFNMGYVWHVVPSDHPAFYCSSRFTLNVTRKPMAEMGYCPSGRLFEAAACGTPVISDYWAGLETFFEPGKEIVIARTTDDVVEATSMSEAERNWITQAAQERTLREHTASHRAVELERALTTTTGACLEA
jgi:spore maturation protein CgeB